MDVIDRPYPQFVIDQPQPGMVAAYDFADNQLAQFGRILNKVPGNPAYDLTGTGGTAPVVGQGGGLFSQNISYRNIAGINPIPVSATTFGQDMIWESSGTPAALSLCGPSNGLSHRFYQTNTGLLWSTVRAGASVAATTYSVTGRGSFVASQRYYGGTHYFYVNRHLAGSLVEAAIAPAGTVYYVGNYGNTRACAVWSEQNPAEQDKFYLKWAKQVVWSWTPKDVGEGPAAGILTGSTPGGYASCPSGGATLQHVWRNDLSSPAGGRLTLTDSNVAGNRHIEIAHTKMPLFGSILVEYTIRDPVTDSPIIGFTPVAGQDPVVAGSNSYWLNMYNTLGGWWRTSLYLANGAQIDAADCAVAPIVAGTRMKALWTRAVDGTNQVYVYSDASKSWFWSAAVPVDVGVLASNYVTICPRGSYMERITRFQGEMTPHELGVVV